MGALAKMFSGTAARKQTQAAEMEAYKKRTELVGLDEDSEARKALRKTRNAASARSGAASTRLSSDTILGGSAPLG